MRHSDVAIVLIYQGDKGMHITGVGPVSQYGDKLTVDSREKADRLLRMYDFTEAGAEEQAQEEDE